MTLKEKFPSFISLEHYKTYAGITSPDNDRKLEGLISRAEGIIRSYCGRGIALTAYSEDATLEGAYLFLKEFPVMSVSSVQYWDLDGVIQTIDPAYYRYFKDEGSIELTYEGQTLINTSKYGGGVNNAKVTYTAGYAYVPEDIKQVTMDIVKYYDKSEYMPVMSANVRTIDYDIFESLSFPPHIRRVLAFYRKVE
jgi:hypothetical protein